MREPVARGGQYARLKAFVLVRSGRPDLRAVRGTMIALAHKLKAFSAFVAGRNKQYSEILVGL